MRSVEDIESVKANLISFCKNAERLSVLEAVRKPKYYREVSRITKLNPTTCSKFLKAMSHLNLVEEVGKRKGILPSDPSSKNPKPEICYQRLNYRKVERSILNDPSKHNRKILGRTQDKKPRPT